MAVGFTKEMTTQKVLSFYSKSSLFTKVFIALRLISCPFTQLIRYIPRAGSLLDIGCGYGVLPLFLVQNGYKDKIVGLEPELKRVEIAKRAAFGYKNITYINENLDSFHVKQKYSTITLIDVLYLLPRQKKLEMLNKAYQLLKPGGKMLIKINDSVSTPAFLLTYLQELMIVHMLHITSTNHAGLYFENSHELSEWLNECGFKLERVVKLSTPFPFFHPHQLLVAVK